MSAVMENEGPCAPFAEGSDYSHTCSHTSASTLPPTTAIATASESYQYNQSLSEHFSLGIASMILICCFFGIILNSISIFIFTRPSMRCSINILLTGLSAIDVVLLVLVIPAFVVPMLNVRIQKVSIYIFTAWSSVCIYPLLMIAQSCSVWTLVLITVERYLAVCHPFKALRLCSQQRSKVGLGVVFTCAVLYNIVRFWEFKLPNPNKEGERFGGKNLRNNEIYFVAYYASSYLITHFFVPFCLLLILNGCVARAILKARNVRRNLTSKEKGEHSTSFMMIVVTVVFALCNILLLILNIIEAFDRNFFSEHPLKAFLLNDTANFFVVLNSATTWIIYFVFGQRYRNLFKLTILKHFSDDAAKRFQDSAQHRGSVPRASFSVTVGLLQQKQRSKSEHMVGMEKSRKETDRLQPMIHQRARYESMPFFRGDNGLLSASAAYFDSRSTNSSIDYELTDLASASEAKSEN